MRSVCSAPVVIGTGAGTGTDLRRCVLICTTPNTSTGPVRTPSPYIVDPLLVVQSLVFATRPAARTPAARPSSLPPRPSTKARPLEAAQQLLGLPTPSFFPPARGDIPRCTAPPFAFTCTDSVHPPPARGLLCCPSNPHRPTIPSAAAPPDLLPASHALPRSPAPPPAATSCLRRPRRDNKPPSPKDSSTACPGAARYPRSPSQPAAGLSLLRPASIRYSFGLPPARPPCHRPCPVAAVIPFVESRPPPLVLRPERPLRALSFLCCSRCCSRPPLTIDRPSPPYAPSPPSSCPHRHRPPLRPGTRAPWPRHLVQTPTCRVPTSMGATSKCVACPGPRR